MKSELMRRMHGQAHECGREHDEDVALNQGYDDFEHEDTDGHGDGGSGEHQAYNQTKQDSEDRVSCEHVGEETNCQSKGTNQEADDFDNDDERHQPARYSGRSK